MFFRSKKEDKKAEQRKGGMPTKIVANKRVVVRRRATGGDAVEFAMLTRLLVQSPEHQQLKLADLSWLVMPALQTRQVLISVARHKPQARPMPAGAVLWASVSAEVDRRLSTQLDHPTRLQPQEWTSGHNLWIVAQVGNAKVVEGLMRKLIDGAFKGRVIKMRGRAPDGKPKILTVDANQQKRAS